jgi:hypothetical protein
MLANEACTVWKKGKGMLDICRMLAPDSLGTSVSYLAKIGSLTDWDQQQIEYEIDKVVLSMCKPCDQAANETSRVSLGENPG